MKRIITSLAITLILNNSSFAQSILQQRIKQVENSLTENLRTQDAAAFNLQKRMEYYKVKGLSIAVIKDYKIDWAKAYGLSDAESKTPVTVSTLFQAASISKSLNAVGVMKLFSSRNLNLFADINTYLSSWKFPYDSLSGGKRSMWQICLVIPPALAYTDLEVMSKGALYLQRSRS